MLTEEQKRKLREAGYNDSKIAAFEQQRSGLKKQGVISETAQDIKQVGSDIKSSYFDRQENIKESIEATKKGEQGGVRTFFQSLGQSAGLVSDVVGAGFKGAVKAVLPQGGEEVLKSGIKSVAEPIVQSDTAQAIMSMYESLDPKTKRDISAAMGAGSLALDVTGVGLGSKAVKKGVQTGKELVKEGVEKTVQTGKELADSAIKTGKNIIAPKPITATQAVGQILQGETSDVVSGVKALSKIDATGVKTFSDLNTKIVDKVKELSNTITKELSKDTTPRKLSQLAVKVPLESGKVTRYNYVKDAIEELKNYYSKIKDIKKFNKITEYEKALDPISGRGISLNDVNNLAKMHGTDLNAFNAAGELASGLTKQAAENTRKGLKETFRQFLTTPAAKKADKLISNLKNTETLVTKNIEAVNKLLQKIQERGLFEKIGYTVAKYGDVLTGGTLRGIVGGLLPRGAGYKVLNMIDIEKALEKNLEILQNAIKSGNDAELKNILKGLTQSKK